MLRAVLYLAIAVICVFSAVQATHAPRVLWNVTALGNVQRQPNAQRGIVYVPEGETLVAHSESSGSVLWSREAGQGESGGLINGQPALSSTSAFFGATNGKIYAVSLSQPHAVQWSIQTKSVIDGAVAISHDETMVFAPSEDGYFRGVNASSGAVIWSFAGTGTCEFVSGAAVDKDTVYFASTFGVNCFAYAVDAKTGRLSWSAPIGQTESRPTVADGVLYFGVQTLGIVALNAKTGATLWTYLAGADGGAAAVEKGVVYAAAGKNWVALNANNGSVIWSAPLCQTYCFQQPTIVGQDIVVGDNSGTITGISKATGAKKWSLYTPGRFGGAVYSATSGSLFYGAFRGNNRVVALQISEPIVEKHCSDADCKNGCVTVKVAEGCQNISPSTSVRRECSADGSMVVVEYEGANCEGSSKRERVYNANKCYRDAVGGSTEIEKCPSQ